MRTRRRNDGLGVSGGNVHRGSLAGIAGAVAFGAIVLGLTLGEPRPASTGEVTFSSAPGLFSVPVRSLAENRFRDIIRQEYDFSCGSAALASLLTYHYGRPTSEEEVFLSMWENGDQAKISQYGFSLLDMKMYLARLGLAADGFQVPLEKLEVASVPAIALINTNGYRHFVVVKGLNDSQVLVGDPALGTRIMGRDEFVSLWNGILFVMRSEGEIGRESFNLEAAWQIKPKPPMSASRFRDSLGSFTLNLPGRGEF